DMTTTSITRGDSPDENVIDTTLTYDVAIQKVGGAELVLATLNNASAIDSQAGSQGVLFGKAGHGAIDLRVTTNRPATANDGSGKPVGTAIPCWDPPT